MNQHDYMPDNVFRYELGKDPDRVQTMVKVMNFSPHREMVVNAVWDTGATFSSVSRRVVRELALPDDGNALSIGVNGQVIGHTSICLAFPGARKWAALVEASHLPDAPGMPDFIIGLDIILLGDLRITREDGTSVLYFTFDKNVFVNFDDDTAEDAMRKIQGFRERLRRSRERFSRKP